MNKIVCTCYDVTNGQIKEAIDNGATNIDEVQEATGAGMACGACIDDIQRLIDYFMTEKEL